jgi:2-polyprenyl-3-methyl-5-hydroxy-6-metoxy-1,4-benzoquinol methylase
MINEQAEQLYSTFIRSEIVQFLPSEYSKVLEIGCNVGNFRQYVGKPCEYWGVEPFKQAAEVAKTKMDKVFADFYDNVKNEIPNNYFDLIIANDVIEHLEQPWDFLKSIKEKMTKNASLVLSIPNVRYFDNLKELLREKDWKYKDVGILDITHLRFFTKKSIIRLLNENGFRIEKMQGINLKKVKKWKLPLMYLLRVIFGTDIIFLQFGIRAIIK